MLCRCTQESETGSRYLVGHLEVGEVVLLKEKAARLIGEERRGVVWELSLVECWVESGAVYGWDVFRKDRQQASSFNSPKNYALLLVWCGDAC